MCFGGGSKPKEPYNAYKGDFQKYEKKFDNKAEQQLAAAEAAGSIEGFDNADDWMSGKLKKISKDPQARMEAKEMMRQYAVKLGRLGIDQAFGQFDDGYFDKYQNDYTNYYFPQLDTQYTDAKDKLTAALAGRGILESTAGFDKLGDLTKEYTDAKANIANDSLGAVNDLRGNIDSAKSNLYALNASSADPMAANAQAIGRATTLVAPPTYSPLGQVFAATLAPYMSYRNAAAGAPTRTYSSPYTAGATGSSSVVR